MARRGRRLEPGHGGYISDSPGLLDSVAVSQTLVLVRTLSRGEMNNVSGRLT